MSFLQKRKNMSQIIGIDIGGTKTSVVCADREHPERMLDKTVFATRTDLGPRNTMDKIEHCVNRMREECARQCDGIGISCGGPLNSQTGTILGPPNLPGWDDIRIVERLQAEFGVKTFLQNDADACALAEWKIGAGKGCRNMIFLTFGTGLGAGLILGGRLYSGGCGMAGEVGHVRLSAFGPAGYGKPGSFEGFCSGGGIAQLAQTVLQSYRQAGRSSVLLSEQFLKAVSAKDVFDAAGQGDGAAHDIVGIVGEQLGKGLALLIDLLNPDSIVIGSIFQRNHALLQPIAERVVAREALWASAQHCRIVPAQLGESLGDCAAVLTAVYGLEEGNHE